MEGSAGLSRRGPQTAHADRRGGLWGEVWTISKFVWILLDQLYELADELFSFENCKMM